MMNHSKKRRSSILKIELDEESTRILGRNRRSSKRVSFADCYQVKEFQRDSPQRWKPDEHDENGDSSDPEVESSNSGKSSGVTGLDKLLSGAIQTPYQDVARYEIPEVALESFNILDANKTVYDSVELDLTETEKHSIYLGGLDGGPAGQPALETSTLLQSIRNGSSDRMKPMQIYSPSRARHNSKEEDPIGPAYFNFTPIQDKENIVPSQNFANMKYYDDDDEHDMEDYNVSPVSSQLDWRSLLGRVFSDDEISMGQTLKRTSTDRAQTMMEEEPMEETVCIGKIVAFGKNRMDISDETVACPKHEYFNDGNWNNNGNTVHIEVPMEETKILGGILSQLNQLEEFESMEETRLVGGILSKTNNQFEAMEETRPIVGILSKTNFQLDVMEETKSIGEILSKSNCQLDAMKEKRPVGGNLSKTNFQLDAMEETRPVGVILSKTNYQLDAMEVTRPVGEILSKTNNQLDATEVIRRVGGIMSKTNYHLDAMEETRPVDGILSKTNNQFEAMEETIPVGGILSKTNNQLETMEETRPVGGILSKTNYQLDAMEETQGVCEILSKTNYQVDAMEETRAVGGILGKTNYQFDAMEETRPVGKILSKTNNQFYAMEETMPVGGILSKTNNQLDAMEETRPVGKILSKTNYQLDAMEETRPVGGILSKSNNQLDAMEVIRHVGGIMSKTNYQLDAMEETRRVVGIMSKTNYQLDAMEETRPVGGILSKTNNQFEAMEETKPVGGILSKTNYQLETMEETRPVGGILSKTNNQLDAMEETIPVGGILSKTNNQLETMEETRPVGGILSKTNYQLDAMEETQGVCEILSKTNYQVDAMEETRAVGGILGKTNYQFDAMEETRPVGKILSKTNNQFYAMEETMPVGGILSETNNQLDAMEETRPVGKILSKTNYQLDAMEETRPVGGILSKSNNQLDAMEVIRHVGGIMSKTNYQLDAMEETRRVVGIMSKTNYQLDAMEETRPVGGILSKTNNQFEAMEETKPVGGILSKTNYQLETMEETRPVGGILSKTNNQLDAMEETKAVGGILGKTNYQLDAMEETRPVGEILSKTNNQLETMEETRPIGGILSKTNNHLETMEETSQVDKILSKTNNQLEAMEETRPVGGILSKTNNQLVTFDETSIENRIPGGSVKRTEIVQDNRPVVGQHGNLKSRVAKIDKTISMSNNANEKQAVETGPKDISIVKNVSLTCVVQNEDFIESLNTLKSLPLVINQEEIMEKDPLSAERSLMEKETCAEVGFDDVRTQDVTQSQTKLLKLKESLLAMKKITGPSIKAGNIKTPSKLSPSLQSYSVQNSIKKLYPTQPNAACSSPVRKRQRLSDPMDCMETVSDIAPLQEATLTTGIDDEEMPDVMNEDYLKDTRETGTLDTSSGGQSVQLQPESPRGPENMSAELTDSSEDAHYSMANYTLQSGMGNKSYMAASFVVPEGPLSLDSFFELTKVKFDLPVKETRRSVFVPRIAQDDIAEVLYVEVAMKPEMDTFSRFKDSISEASNSLLEDIRLVEEGLEQSQPDIFAQVVNASPDQLAATKEELWELHRRCKVIARVNYKNQMTDLYAGFLRCLQTNVQVRANQKVAQMQAHVKTVDDLLERLKQGVIDIEQEEKSLEEKQSIMITLDRQIATEKESCVHLETELEALSLNTETSRQDCHELQAKEQCLQAIKGHFICSEWKLEDLREDVVVVSFHKGLIEMTIKFNSSAHDNLQDLQITSGPSSGNIGDRVFQSFALASIKTSNLQNQYPTRMKLPMLFHEVSSSLNELKRFCADLELVHFYKEIQFHDNELSVNMWSVYGAMRSFVTLKFIFNTLNPLRSPVQSTVCVKFGDICARDIEVQLGAVQPGHRYLTRLLDAVVSHNPCLSWKY